MMVDVRNGGGEVSSFRAVNHPNIGHPEPAHNIPKSSTALDHPSPPKVSGKASAKNSTPAAGAARSTHGTPAAEPLPQSQPMTATTSASSHASAKDVREPVAAPYGTRSRNRPGTSRINYAEDVEMDFEMANAPANSNMPDAPPRGSLGTENRQSPSVGGRKGNGGQGSWGNNVSNAKDTTSNLSIPGTSTFSANPNVAAAQPPKRRKNAAHHSANVAHANAATPSNPQARRSAHTHNYTVSANQSRESNMMTFEKTGAVLQDGKLIADDGQTVSINDQVYLICEPPGEPYYLCRIMEFVHAKGDVNARVESLRVNWFYRPRDVQRYNNDTRLVYATMHSDICPIMSLRGRCRIMHRTEIDDLDEYRKTKDSFWFNQVFDRFIHRWYDVIPTSQVINVPDKVKKALDERWKYICVETSRVKELTSAVKTCKRCVGFCANNDSVQCAVCHNTYHMNCVRPPLAKKPSRGFAWACAPCSRAQEKKLEARRTPLVGGANDEHEEEELVDEEEEDPVAATTAPSPNTSDAETVDSHPGTQAEIALAKMWPMRYLGIHCRLEDALQYDDRAIYPRASSRLGPRHQANVNVWHGRPVELVKRAEIKKRYVKSAGKKDTKLSKETVAAIEADKAERAKRPKWVLDEPEGYVRRGEDHPNKDPNCTAELLFKMPSLGVHSTRGDDDAAAITEEQVQAYMKRAKAFATDIGVKEYSTNFLDKCLQLLTKNNYDVEAALKQVKKIDRRKDLHEPELTKDEEKRWNEGVAKYGSEIRSVRLHVKTISHADAVRYYYMWKKTPKGREIWGSYSNRKGRNRKAEVDDAATRLLDDVADDQDDSAFDSMKAEQRKRGFQCKFCSTRKSRQWRRAPGVVAGQTVSPDGKSKDKSGGYVVALCQRCANLWRKYAVKWENTDEIAKKVAQGGGKAWKRRIDEELLREVYAAASETTTPPNGASEYAEPPPAAPIAVAEPPKKKQKTTPFDKDSGTATPVAEPAPKKKEKEKVIPPPKAPTPPPVPAQPREKVLPCAVCRQFEFTPDTRLVCSSCKLTTHKACYGAEDVRHGKWFCDTCRNDKQERVSYSYECVLCPVKLNEQELIEPPKVSHKKKTDREREKERLEKELVDNAREQYRQSQQDKGRPIYPREPLKKTADNNWVHVYCAIWHPETKFSNARRLDIVEGIGAPTLRYDLVCKICKTSEGACVACQQCHANFHVGCAHSAGYTFGFDITPVKATRRDTIPTVTINGETGSMTAAIWCKEHATPKTIVHAMNEQVEGTNTTALQLFARQFKQADLTLTGTARKANLVDQSTRTIPLGSVAAQGNRRTSTTTNQIPTSGRGRPSNAGIVVKDEEAHENTVAGKAERKCASCKIDASPRWWKLEDPAPQPPSAPSRNVDSAPATNGIEHPGNVSSENTPTPRLENLSLVNGSADQRMTGAAPVAPTEGASILRAEQDASGPKAVKYLCQKCHWKKENAPDEPPEPERTLPPLPEPTLPLALQSPPVSSFGPPLGPAPWMPGSVSLPPQQPLPPTWHGHPPALHHPPMQNGLGHPPPPPIPLSHPPPYHAPYGPVHQSNGFPPYTGPSMHPSILPTALRPAFPPSVSGAPPPLHLNSQPLVVNGLPSPHLPYSPTHLAGPSSSRAPESAYPGSAQHPPYPALHHGSPIPGNPNRPGTPRDTTMRDVPPPSVPPEARPNTGASASPSLRNLLH